MWCPKCKNEYVEGVTTCADCGCELVAELPEEINPEGPQIIGSVTDEESGNKYIRFFHFSGVTTCGLIPREEKTGFDLAVRYEELPLVYKILSGLAKRGAEDDAAPDRMIPDSAEAADSEPDYENAEKFDLDGLVPVLDKQLEEIKNEEANELLSDLRTEASTVYVNKKDKFTDLKFSGYSFLIFAAIGYAIVAVNAAGIIRIFNTYSTAILAVVFTIFLGIGISSLLKAGKVKRLVSEEENMVEKVQQYIDETFTDDYLASLGDEDLPEEEQFFYVTGILKKELAEQFPLFSKAYGDQLIDDRYGEFCDSRESNQDTI